MTGFTKVQKRKIANTVEKKSSDPKVENAENEPKPL